MTSFPVNRTLLHPADAKLLRVSFTYVLPGLAVFYVVLSGLWLLSDGYAGMYGNHDGHWASWTARGILGWRRPCSACSSPRGGGSRRRPTNGASSLRPYWPLIQ